MSFADRDGVIWMDGELVPWRDANVHILTHSLHYGVAVFEGLRAYKTDRGTAIFRLHDHSLRLLQSAKILGMKPTFDADTLDQAQRLVVRENNLQTAYIRPLVYYGTEGVGLRADQLSTHVGIACWEWGSYLGEEGMTKGIRIRTSSYTRHHVNSAMCRAKASGNYINSILGLQEAISCGYDEALFLDHQGFVMEGSGENIFIVRDNTVYTPSLSSALDGISRRTVMTLLREVGVEVIEKQITRDEVYIADEAFFTGTAAEVTPIRELDNRQIGEGSRGPITEQAQQLYFASVEGRGTHTEWLNFI